MFVWIITTVLTAVAAVMISAPFIWWLAVRHSTAARAAHAQSARPESVENAGTSDPTKSKQEQSTPIAIQPPPLADNRTSNTAGLDSSRSGWIASAIAGVGALVVIGVFGIRALTDDPQTSPDRSALPSPSGTLQAFPKTPSPMMNKRLKEFATAGTRVQGVSGPASGLPAVDEMIGRLITRLQRNPKDVEGWRTLGWSYFNLQKYDESAAAYSKAIELNPKIVDFHSARGEALVRAANGTVTGNAQQAFNDALRLDTKDPRARFYIGLAKMQAGEKTAALEIWIELANDVAPNDPMISILGQRIAELAKELDVDVSQKLRRPLNPVARNLPKGDDASGTSRLVEQGDPRPAIDSKTSAPADQSAMIRTMVDNLATRLEGAPRDVDGWIRLIRSRQVLNDPDAARQALEKALKVFDDNSAERDRLVMAAKELGLSP